eukprot:6999207-Pyramimonas_sp.AAC.1
MHRIWQRLRRPTLSEVMGTLDRGYWGATLGRSAVDFAWALAARSEADTANHRFSVLVVADFSKYSETIDLSRLRDKCMAFRVPSPLLKLVFTVWQAPRILRMRQHHSLNLPPSRWLLQ